MRGDGELLATGVVPYVPSSGDAANIPAGPVIWFEVEDVLRWFDHSSAATGIQRVCHEIFTEAERLCRSSSRVRFCRLSFYTGHFEAIDFPAVIAAYRGPAGVHGPASVLARTVGRQGILLKLLHLMRAAPRLARWLFRIVTPILRDCVSGRAQQRRFEQLVAPGDIIVCLSGPWLNRKYSRHVAAIKRTTGARFAVLIHDIVSLADPTASSSSAVTRFGPWLKQIVVLADALFTVSDFSRRELVDYAARAGWTLPPVDVLRLGTGFREIHAATADRVRSFPERYVLFVSTIEVRKNHILLLRVWRRLLERYGDEAVPRLLFVGRIGWLIDDVVAELTASNFLNGKIMLLSDLSDAEVREAYRGCVFTVYPSRYEGWGLPVAESLMHGKFCVASDRASLPEVGGDFVDYFDPTDENDALAKIERVLFEPGYLAAREARLRAEYRPPSWADCARLLIDTIDRRLPLATLPQSSENKDYS